MPAPLRVAEVEALGLELARAGRLSSRSLAERGRMSGRSAQHWLRRWRREGIEGRRLVEVERAIVSPSGRGCPLSVYGLAP